MYGKIYLWFLNLFTLAVLLGLVYFIWMCGKGFEWYWRAAWVIGLFGAGALLAWACSRGFGVVPVRIINLPPQDQNNGR